MLLTWKTSSSAHWHSRRLCHEEIRPPPSLWKCGNPALFAGFPSPVERVENSLWFFEFSTLSTGRHFHSDLLTVPCRSGRREGAPPEDAGFLLLAQRRPGMFFSQEVKQ